MILIVGGSCQGKAEYARGLLEQCKEMCIRDRDIYIKILRMDFRGFLISLH